MDDAEHDNCDDGNNHHHFSIGALPCLGVTIAWLTVTCVMTNFSKSCTELVMPCCASYSSPIFINHKSCSSLPPSLIHLSHILQTPIKPPQPQSWQLAITATPDNTITVDPPGQAGVVGSYLDASLLLPFSSSCSSGKAIISRLTSCIIC